MNKKQYSIIGADLKVLGRGTSRRGGRSRVCVREVIGCSVVFGALVAVCIVIASL